MVGALIIGFNIYFKTSTHCLYSGSVKKSTPFTLKIQLKGVLFLRTHCRERGLIEFII